MWPRVRWMVSRSVRFESLGVELGKEHHPLWDSLRGTCRLGYSREQEVLEHVGGLGISPGCLVHQQSY